MITRLAPWAHNGLKLEHCNVKVLRVASLADVALELQNNPSTQLH